MTRETNSYFLDKFSAFEHKLIWCFNNYCNFSCEYCFSKDLFGKIIPPEFAADNIAEAFAKTKKSWLITLTGGEPFLYKNFVGLVEELIKKNTVAFSTNLSTDNIDEFIDRIDPSKILLINASYHPEYRNKINEPSDSFVKKVLKLQENNFEIIVTHVAYPPFLPQLKAQFDHLKKQGIKNISALAFRSIYNNTKYPDAYTEEEIEIIARNSIDQSELKIAKGETDFHGHYCNAGNNFFFMDNKGNIQRCGSISKRYGNLFNGSFKPETKPKPCTVHDCLDCYLGFVSVTDKKASKLNMLLEKYGKKKNEIFF